MVKHVNDRNVHRHRRFAFKSGMFIVVSMILLTFYSNTIHYLYTPKVMIAHPLSGRFEEVYNLGDADLIYSDTEVLLGIKLTIPLTVSIVHVQEGQKVKKGDPIISFDVSAYDKQLDALELQEIESSIQIDVHKHNLEKHIATLRNGIREQRDILSELRSADTVELLTRERTRLANDLTYIQGTGVYKSTTLNIMLAKRERLEKSIEAAKKLVDSAASDAQAQYSQLLQDASSQINSSIAQQNNNELKISEMNVKLSEFRQAFEGKRTELEIAIQQSSDDDEKTRLQNELDNLLTTGILNGTSEALLLQSLDNLMFDSDTLQQQISGAQQRLEQEQSRGGRLLHQKVPRMKWPL